MNELFLNSELYDEISLKRAIIAFSNIATIEYIRKNKYWVCNFVYSRASIKKTQSEFENYLISLVNREGIKHGSL